MKLVVLDSEFGVARLAATDPTTAWTAQGSIASVTRTTEELSVGEVIVPVTGGQDQGILIHEGILRPHGTPLRLRVVRQRIEADPCKGVAVNLDLADRGPEKAFRDNHVHHGRATCPR